MCRGEISPSKAGNTSQRGVALITAIAGQDGSYLAEFLLEKGYDVHGIVNESSSADTLRISHILDRLRIHYCDVNDASSAKSVVAEVCPDEVYHFVVQTHVEQSLEDTQSVVPSECSGTMALLEAIRATGLEHSTRFYLASTSELGSASPSELANLSSYHTVVSYREKFGIFACNGILVNHESPRAAGSFAMKKVTSSVARLVAGMTERVYLDDIDSKRDLGHARDYVRAMWLALQHNQPEDFVIATSKQHSTRDVCTVCFQMIGREIVWQGVGRDEEGVDAKTGEVLVQVSQKRFRATEAGTTLAETFDVSKAHKELGWHPEFTFKHLVREMMDYDLQRLGEELPECAQNIVDRQDEYS